MNHENYIMNNAPYDVIDKINALKRGDFGIIDTIVLIMQIVVILIGVGLTVPAALWAARKIISSARRTGESVKRK